MSAGTSNPLAGAIVEPPSLKPGSLASFSFSNMEELKAGKEPLPASPRSSLSKNIHKLSLVDAASKIGGNNSGLARSSLGSKPVSPSGYQLSRLSEERLDDKERYKRSNGADERGPSGMRNSRSPIYRPKSELLQTSRDWSPAQSPKSRNNKFQLPNKSSESSNNNNNNNNVTRKQRSNSTNRWSALEDAADLVGAEEDADEGSLSMMLTLARTRSVDHQSGGRNVFAAGGRANLKHTNNTNHINTTNTNNNSNSTNHINGTRTTPIRNKPRAETLGWRSPGAATRREEALVASPKGVRDTRRIKNVLSTDALPQLAKMAMVCEMRRKNSFASKGNVESKEMLSQMAPIDTSQIDCKFFNFARGKCTFGKQCFYRHANLDGTLYEETSGGSLELLLRYVRDVHLD
ncbi:hypothetical protein SARC_08037 [Sphaeroforma arctica JP610]|uniref:C3H1-type domain-containing protein n=1 Tax=Sphaeroforma arctica JP610 TaxID=667725 RepID=A0A0L0FSN1_9EUKA|nr:hypothetical protein SARC_08037 [Sphaeroforma arctica JP610]KNC79576.1 hypothetical protein SARC_08037 [Sphaeroforma arctica JP610]|eukprot:XP_014153478.1 hypothetical protein SARC_08037 [Sphaeroforma arctica JP610]